jgi:hypothetical protein
VETPKYILLAVGSYKQARAPSQGEVEHMLKLGVGAAGREERHYRYLSLPPARFLLAAEILENKNIEVVLF